MAEHLDEVDKVLVPGIQGVKLSADRPISPSALVDGASNDHQLPRSHSPITFVADVVPNVEVELRRRFEMELNDAVLLCELLPKLLKMSFGNCLEYKLSDIVKEVFRYRKQHYLKRQPELRENEQELSVSEENDQFDKRVRILKFIAKRIDDFPVTPVPVFDPSALSSYLENIKRTLFLEDRDLFKEFNEGALSVYTAFYFDRCGFRYRPEKVVWKNIGTTALPVYHEKKSGRVDFYLPEQEVLVELKQLTTKYLPYDTSTMDCDAVLDLVLEGKVHPGKLKDKHWKEAEHQASGYMLQETDRQLLKNAHVYRSYLIYGAGVRVFHWGWDGPVKPLLTSTTTKPIKVTLPSSAKPNKTTHGPVPKSVSTSTTTKPIKVTPSFATNPLKTTPVRPSGSVPLPPPSSSETTKLIKDTLSSSAPNPIKATPVRPSSVTDSATLGHFISTVDQCDKKP